MFRSLRTSLQPVKPVLLPVWCRLSTSRLFARAVLAYASVPERSLFCVGMMKTGTHSIASMVEASSGHEPETHVLWHLYRRVKRGAVGRAHQAEVLRARAALLDLDVEANWLLTLHLPALVEGFPHARFLLTVREPRAWVNSVINQEVGGQNRPYVWAWRELFGGYDHPPAERALKAHGHFSLEGYLRRWSTYHERALRILPPQRTLVIRTADITDCTEAIAAFSGHAAARDQSRQYVRTEKPHEIATLVDEEHVKAQVARFAGATWDRILDRVVACATPTQRAGREAKALVNRSTRRERRADRRN